MSGPASLLLSTLGNWTVNVSLADESPIFDSGSGYGSGRGQDDLASFGGSSSSIDLGSLDPSSSSSSSGSLDGVKAAVGSCRDWQDAQHTLFQFANLCAAVSLLTPSSFRHHLLFLRCLLLLAFLLFVLWAGLFVCMLDALIWNSLFFLVDLVHVVSLAYHNVPSRFNASLQEVYTKKFKPLKVYRKEFSELCAIAKIISLRKGTRYAVEGLSPCGEKVSILVRGRMRVTHGNTFLHFVEANEFVDSLEFDAVPFHVETNDKFQVTMTAMEDSMLLSWQYPSLRALLASNNFVWTVFTSLVGKDISDKLYRIQELIVKDPDSMLSTPTTPCPTPHLHSSRCDVSCRSASFPRSPCHANVPKRLSEPLFRSLHPLKSTGETNL